MSVLSSFIKYQRKRLNLTQEELAEKAGVGIRFIREMEQGKESLRLNKVNQVLSLFGFCLAPAKIEIDPYYVALNFKNDVNLKHINKSVKIVLKNKTEKFGFIIDEIIDSKTNRISAWKFVSNNNAVKYQKNKDNNLTEVILHSDIQEIEEL